LFFFLIIDNVHFKIQNDFKTQELPLARIKKIMKLDEDVKVRAAASVSW